MSGTIAVETHRESLHLVLIHAHIHLLEDIFILTLFVTLDVNSSENFNIVSTSSARWSFVNLTQCRVTQEDILG